MRISPRLLPALLALACLPLAGCLPSAYSVPTVKIGLVAPLTGEAADEGYRWVYAAKQAIATWNAAGHGVQAELVADDDADGPPVAARLAADAGVAAVVGHWRPDVAAAAWPVYGKAGLPVLGMAYNGCEPQPRSLALCVAPTRAAIGDAISSFIAGRFGKNAEVAVVAGPDLNDMPMAEALRASATAAGLEVVRAEAALPYTNSYAAIAGRIGAEKVAATVFTGSLTASEAFGREGAAAGMRVLVPHRTTAGGRLPEGFTFAPFGAPAGAAYASFVRAYQEAWGQPPSAAAAAVYDATGLALRAFEAGGGGGDLRKRAAEALRSNRPFAGVLGEYRVENGLLRVGTPPQVVGEPSR